MKIVIINGSARKGNTLTAINAFIKGASGKNDVVKFLTAWKENDVKSAHCPLL